MTKPVECEEAEEASLEGSTIVYWFYCRSSVRELAQIAH